MIVTPKSRQTIRDNLLEKSKIVEEVRVWFPTILKDGSIAMMGERVFRTGKSLDLVNCIIRYEYWRNS